MPPGSCAVDDAQQRAGAKAGTELKPWLELSPAPAIHADLATATTLPAPDKNCAAGAICGAVGGSDAVPASAVAAVTAANPSLLDATRLGTLVGGLLALRSA